MKYLLPVLLFSLLFQSSAICQDRNQLKEEIDKTIYFDTEISHDKIPGFSIGIIFQDSVFIYHYGTASKKSDQMLTDSSLFEIGSVTKTFTSSLVSILVEENLLSYDSTLNSYLDQKYRNKYFDTLTIRNLVQHTANLPKMPVDFGAHEKELNNPYAHYTKKQLLRFYKKYRPIPLGKKDPRYMYSHVSYGLLEIAIEKVTGKDYESLLNEKVLTPMGLNNTFAAYDEHEKSKDKLTKAYSRNGKHVPHWDFQSFTASEGLKSNVTDLVSYLKHHLELEETPYDSLLNDNTSPKINTGFSENAFMGNGWHIIKLKKYYNAVLHSGSSSGHRAFIGFVKETKTGVVLLSNSESGTGGLGYLLLRLINYNWKKDKKSKKKKR